MKLEELEKLIKEMKKMSAYKNTEVSFYKYTAEYGYEEVYHLDTNLYSPEVRNVYIDIKFI